MTEDQLRLKIAINLDDNFDKFCLKANDLFTAPQVLQIIKNKFARKLHNNTLSTMNNQILKGISSINQLSSEELEQARALKLMNELFPAMGNITGADITINNLDYAVDSDDSFAMATEVLPIFSRIVTVPKTAQRPEKLLSIISVQLTNDEFITTVFDLASDLNDDVFKKIYDDYYHKNYHNNALNYAYYQFVSQAENLKILNNHDQAPSHKQKLFYKSLITNPKAFRGNKADLEKVFQNFFGIDISKKCGMYDQNTEMDGIIIDLRDKQEIFMNQAQALNIGQRQKSDQKYR